MGEPIFLGFGDLYATAGDHIGHFYQTREEWKAILIPFFTAGLRAGEQCVYMLPPGPGEQDIRTALRAAEIDVEHALASGQLILAPGKTTATAMREWFQTLIAAIPGHYRLLRWGGDMTWSLRQMPTSEMLMEWETLCNTLQDLPAIFLCQYDLTRFLGSVVVDALRTHPLCIIHNVIHRNPFYTPPSVFLAELRSRQGKKSS
ncbi:MAG: hypothetical protein D6736_14975 [Nitrospinota bacterium]|nr:MAG: hypothetical protein D6736_14975 [Nitrospinota bacterium]